MKPTRRHVQEITRLEVLSSREKRDTDIDQLRVEKAALDQRVNELHKLCEDKDEELEKINAAEKEESDAQRRFLRTSLTARGRRRSRRSRWLPCSRSPLRSCEIACERRSATWLVWKRKMRLGWTRRRVKSDHCAIGSPDLEFEKAQLQERPPPPPPSPSLDATQRMHALALKDATIADLRKRIESNTDLPRS